MTKTLFDKYCLFASCLGGRNYTAYSPTAYGVFPKCVRRIPQLRTAYSPTAYGIFPNRVRHIPQLRTAYSPTAYGIFPNCVRCLLPNDVLRCHRSLLWYFDNNICPNIFVQCCYCPTMTPQVCIIIYSFIYAMVVGSLVKSVLQIVISLTLSSHNYAIVVLWIPAIFNIIQPGVFSRVLSLYYILDIGLRTGG